MRARWGGAAAALAAVGAMLASASGARAWTHTTSDENPDLALWWQSHRIAMRPHCSGAPGLPADVVCAAIQRSMDEWNSQGGAHCGDMVLVEGAEPSGLETNLSGDAMGLAPHGDGENRIVWRTDEWFGDPDAIAVTMHAFNSKTGQISDADIDINATVLHFTVTDEPGAIETDLENTLTHELGHVIGLGHSDVPDSTMFFRAGPGETSKRTLSDDDIDGACTLYPREFGVATWELHGETTTHCAVAAPGSNGVRGAVPAAGALAGAALLGIIRGRRRRPRAG